MSTTKTEYITVFRIVQQAMWLSFFFDEVFLSQKQLVTLFIDNNKAIDMTKIYWEYKRVKHIYIQHHFFKEKVKMRESLSVYTSSKDDVADLFIKPLLKDITRNFTADFKLYELVRV